MKNNESKPQTLKWEDCKDFDKRELFDFLRTQIQELQDEVEHLEETRKKYDDLLDRVFERDDELYQDFLSDWGVVFNEDGECVDEDDE